MVNFNKNALKILEKRYLLKDDKGTIIESPEEMLYRVANTVCGDDENLKNEYNVRDIG